jgi:AraC-like DNA-binding protein
VSEARQEGIDPLSDALRAVRLTGAFFFRIDASSPWVAALPAASALAPHILPRAQHVVSYHVIVRGRCWAGLGGTADTRLEEGDLVVIPHGDPYVLSTERGGHGEAPLELALSFFREIARLELLSTVREGGGGPERLHVVCGFLGCDVLPFNPLLSTLPRLVHLRPPQQPGSDRLAQLVEFALTESREQRAGSDCVLLRLSELMFVEMLRRYLACLPPEETGWLAALRDPTVGRALRLLHQEPGRAWTVDELARQAGLSRSVLSERFTQLLGLAPIQYLTRWRMQVAARLLTDAVAKVSAVALEVGYDSEAAFSRAFKKAVGVAPAAWRDRQARVSAGRAS